MVPARPPNRATRQAGSLAAGLVGGLVLVAGPAVPQDVPPRLVFDLGSSLTYNDNPDLAPGGSDPRLAFDTSLGLTLNSTTRTQSFALGIKGLARLDADGLALRDPAATLAYTLLGADSRLSVNLEYRQADVDLFEPVPQADGSQPLLATTGTVTSQSARLGFATGLRAPLGLDLAASVSARDYSDTTDPAVYDSTSHSLTLGAHLRMPDAGRDISLTASSSASDYDDLLQTSRTGQGLTLGLTQALRPGLTLQASLGQSTATSRMFGVVVSQSTGLTGSIGLQAELANGTASASLSSARDAVGPRETLSLSRSMDLPNGALAVRLGLASRAGQQGQIVGALSYGIDLPTDSFDISLSREVTLNTGNQDVADTVLGLDYQHQITGQSRLGLSIDLTDTGSGGSAGVAGSQRQTVTASYSQDLAADWQWTAGYTFRSLDTSTAERANANSVSLTISRKFTLRP